MYFKGSTPNHYGKWRLQTAVLLKKRSLLKTTLANCHNDFNTHAFHRENMSIRKTQFKKNIIVANWPA